MWKRYSELLVDTHQINKLLTQGLPYLTIVNANFGFSYTTHVARPAEDWLSTFNKERIPTARHVNIGLLGDKSQNLPNMLPTVESFTSKMKELDIGKHDHVICYGDENLMGACRAWWMFTVFGFKNVQILNGTIKSWKKDGYKVESGEETWKNIKRKRKEEDFQFTLDKSKVSFMDQIRKLIDEKKNVDQVTIVDARSEGRFAGEHKDPKGLKVGHIPGSKNIYFEDIVNLEQDEKFKGADELAKIIKEKNVDIHKPIIATCGSAMSATMLNVAFYIAGAKDVAIYDGSWVEWVKHPENPVETGPPK
jgi:thiosulfate/3-mercaptopyruvate sulfurtransferase